MTPASSDRYQSRLFRFVYKQSRRFTQQCERAWRNLQSTASWVAAIGLYPLFLLLQSRRSTANQVNRAVEATLRQLPAEEESILEEPPTVDTPIRQVLLYVKGAGSREQGAERTRRQGHKEDKGELTIQNPKSKIQNSPTTHYSPLTTHSIQGIASQLSSRSLVIVTAQNQSLDVLDPQQQQALQEEIIAAIAAYWQYRRSRNQSRLPTPDSRLPTPPWLTSLDHTVAEVESHHLVRVKSTAIAFYQSIFSPSTELSGADRPASEVWASSSKTHTTRIISLIWAAIDYFFGTGDRVSPMTTGSRNEVTSRLAGTIPAKPNPATRPSARLPVSRNLADEELEDPWLSASDLFGAVVASTSDPPNPPCKGRQQSTPPISRLQNAGERRSLPKSQRGMRKIGFERRISPSKSQQEIRGIGSVNRTLPPFPRGVGGIGSRANAAIHAPAKGKQSLQKAENTDISNSAAKNSSVQPTPDWIETPATLMGYVKHPLEQILAWLDRTMLWLEETLFKFWQWMQKMWRKF